MTEHVAPLSREELLSAYRSYGRPRESWLVGAELERHILGPDGLPAPYFGEHGISWLLDQLVAEGWSPKHEGDHLIALLKNGASVTLEPGGQFELSGRPHRTARGVLEESTAFADDVARILAPTPFRQVALGFTPFADVHQIPWVPKGRYAIMRDHMELAGSHGHHMMKGTAATQASYDFADEADCAAKLRAAMLVAPIVHAIFANSPYELGQANGWQSFRGFIWTRTDPARTGFPEAATSFSFEAWVDYLLDVPMMFTHIGGVWRRAEGQTFRQWMTHGNAEGQYPTIADWDLHQTSVFPEVRVKHLIEARMGDCVPTAEVGAFSALFLGLLYGVAGTGELESRLADFAADGVQPARFLAAARDGLRATIGGRSMRDWALDTLDLARAGLAIASPDDASLLDGVQARVQAGQTRSDLLLARLGNHPAPDALRDATAPHAV